MVKGDDMSVDCCWYDCGVLSRGSVHGLLAIIIYLSHPFNQVDIAVFVELLSIFMKELRLRIWTQGLSKFHTAMPYETLISSPRGL